MTTFWLLCALLSLLAMAILLWPVLRVERDDFARRAAALRDQLKVLELAVSDGLLLPEQAEPRREALRTALLQAIDAPTKLTSKPPVYFIAVMALVLPISALGLYRAFGTPHAVAFAPVQAARSQAQLGQTEAGQSEAPAVQNVDGSAPNGEQGPDLREAVEGLAARMKDKPDDEEGQLLLARTWRELAEFTKARDAYALVVAKRGEDPDVLAEYAETYGLAQEPRSLLGKPTEILEQVLKISPTHQRALWLRGFAYRQTGELPKALQVWDQVLKQLPPESEIASALTQQINIVRSELGQPPLPVAAGPGSGGTGLPENTGQLDAPDPVRPNVAAPDVAGPNVAAPNGVRNASSSAPANPAASTPAPEQAAAATGSAAQPVTILVELDPKLESELSPNDVLFVFARADQGPPMPLAIQRLPARDFPITVTLSDENAMAQGMTLSNFQRVKIGARISKSGQAIAQSGDLQGFSEVFSQPAADAVKVTIGERVE